MAETLKQFKERVAYAVMDWDRGDGCKEEFLESLGLEVPNKEVKVVATATFLTEERAGTG